jgi:hypothetical protein
MAAELRVQKNNVIPGLPARLNPESPDKRTQFWIPGSHLPLRPGMTA